MAVGNTSDRIRILLVDDLVLAREALSRFLGSQPDFAIAGQCGSAIDALGRLSQLSVDVVIIENRLTHSRGLPFLSAVLNSGYRGSVLVIADPSDLEESGEVLASGSASIFPKDSPLDSLVDVIRQVAAGKPC